jgi:hypothetical protein
LEELRVLQVKRWQQKENNRGEGWASVVKDAKVLRGPQSKGINK